MARRPEGDLRTGYTTGACAAAAAKAAALALATGRWASPVEITLPRGECVAFELVETAQGEGWARASVQKDAGDDPDVTHGALIVVTVRRAAALAFRAGPGVGMVTKPGLPIAPGEPAINPVPREMMTQTVEEMAQRLSKTPDVIIEISVPGGREIAEKT
ncbi:MAG: cobalt-precorrin-5B (C(1))-methyltransferase, partial [Pseudomonadota bacterium]